jgi:hypothetical protein
MGAKDKAEPTGGARSGERRWPISVAVLVAVALQLITPHAGRLPSWWTFPVLELLLLGILIARDPGRIDASGPRVHRPTVGLLVAMTIGLVAGLVVPIVDIVHVGFAVSAEALLGRGATLWATNVIVFSLWYWVFDRGGPAQRAERLDVAPSFAFPENAMPELVPKGWAPQYSDYLYLSFTNATAFSPTDTLPLRP